MAITKINVGMASCGLASGARQVFDKLEETIGDKIPVKRTGCIGVCAFEPIVDLIADNGIIYRYKQVTKKIVQQIVENHIIGGTPIEEYILPERILKSQLRVVMRNTGHIDPESIEDYEDRDGYVALRKVLTEMTQEEVIEEIKRSGLRGRGGAGFPTGLKWEFAYKSKSDIKYLICNADEGDPGAFMDRNILESDPHSVIEGMVIAGYAIGIKTGYIYCRAEYPLAIHRLTIALNHTREKGYLGNNLLGTDISFDIRIKEGAGAYVCGEETALISSIEGKRGNPYPKPPYPAQSGLWSEPTNINNVKTFANVSWIIRNGWKKFQQIGVKKSPGTAIFSLAGKIKNSGMIEVPMGTTLREIVYDVGGGVLNDKEFKAVQTGGPSGGCLPSNHLDLPVDYESMAASGSIMGSGGMIVLDETDCMVKLAHYFLTFTQEESCGKCVPCRIGTRAMQVILERIIQGKGEEQDLLLLKELSETVKMGSLCGLGQNAPNPVLTTLRYFPQEYEAHIFEKRCLAKDCNDLIEYEIDEATCIGCRVCARNCPVNAISGMKDEVHSIDPSICSKCGICYSSCPHDAIFKQDQFRNR